MQAESQLSPLSSSKKIDSARYPAGFFLAVSGLDACFPQRIPHFPQAVSGRCAPVLRILQRHMPVSDDATQLPGIARAFDTCDHFFGQQPSDWVYWDGSAS